MASVQGEGIPVSKLSIESRSNLDSVTISEVLRSETYLLGRDHTATIVASSESAEEISFGLDSAPKASYTISALIDLQQQMVTALNDAGFYGVVVIANPEQIDSRTGEDLREGSRGLTFDVWINEVVEVRTVGKGDRIKGKDPLNNKIHGSILSRSPLSIDPEDESSTFIDKPKLDNYLERLNQHPGQRVDAALSSAGTPGEVVLDYVVSESKPWVVYAQLSNTGTESTGEWRQRFGGSHYQLTGHNDILTVDYLTAGFDRSNAFAGSYQIPLMKPDYIIGKVYGSFSDFEAENLVVNTAPDFTGETVTYGAEVAFTPVYFMKHALSLKAGFKSEDITVENILGNSQGQAELQSPYIRLEAYKNKQNHRSFLSLGYETNLSTIDQFSLGTGLGRLRTTDEYDLLTFDAYQSFFLEPLFFNYHQPDPDKWYTNALVHELAFSARGQFSLGDERLIPQKQLYAGGYFSARGYNESVVAGDNGIIASAEYRFHISRLLKPASLLDEDRGAPAENAFQRFNFRSPDVYGAADWNFLIRGFVDYATLEINDIGADEFDNDLLSAGIGFELQVKSYLNLRVDYGVVLEDAENASGIIEGAASGDSRLHILATFSY
ncbi:MAG: ShlB/FhaC/HecB family hemolysin secretion/activation protein [Opitutaceae bacterium]